ncbi:hypothetical protein ACFWA1_35855 [Streptomyces sp. NPDC060005]|uniref:hypothetical protein n=1 Tax=Streptomyces sp. NPDC060005 TaxID=3347034 RepID=UPI0036ACAC52
MRVSHDNGAHFDGPSTVVVPHAWRADAITQLRDFLTGWPPCSCPRHRAAGTS